MSEQQPARTALAFSRRTSWESARSRRRMAAQPILEREPEPQTDGAHARSVRFCNAIGVRSSQRRRRRSRRSSNPPVRSVLAAAAARSGEAGQVHPPIGEERVS